ncbi:hypothetical protein CC80DRAFT_559517 [Byssothecium circinans]|uniref:Zn(2)-C6 fungal-type domain-containing protein n=1 Tax=Byssothecium circinans TaxID=147558 RepID=A0A6A5U0P2_9PLEO|nr:hypothetical protein CC80DRAFT_559517 [Byssothecium circinans]
MRHVRSQRMIRRMYSPRARVTQIRMALDEKRPSCDRCKKRRLQCDGPKDPTWIISQMTTSSLSRATTPLSRGIPSDPSFIAFDDDLCLAYASTYLLRGGNVELAYDKIHCQVGASTDPFSPGLSLLRSSGIGLATPLFGSCNRRKAITNRGNEKYGDVLNQLNWYLAQTKL